MTAKIVDPKMPTQSLNLFTATNFDVSITTDMRPTSATSMHGCVEIISNCAMQRDAK